MVICQGHHKPQSAKIAQTAGTLKPSNVSHWGRRHSILFGHFHFFQFFLGGGGADSVLPSTKYPSPGRMSHLLEHRALVTLHAAAHYCPVASLHYFFSPFSVRFIISTATHWKGTGKAVGSAMTTAAAWTRGCHIEHRSE